MSYPLLSTLLLSLLLAAPVGAQELTNEPVYLGEEGPSPLRREHVVATGAVAIRWERTPDHTINTDTGHPGAYTDIVVARWDAKACAEKRGPFCRERGAWAPKDTLASRALVDGIDGVDITASDHYIVFGRSRFRPSRPNSWKSDLLIEIEELDTPAGARRLLFDTSTSVGGGVRYSVILAPLSP